jgi:alpha-tubulin suppressor-like RCC1 family protein
VSTIFTLTAAIEAGESGVTAIACGYRNSYLLKDDKAYAVGNNDNGQIGRGSFGGDYITSFTAMIGEGLSGVTAIAAGQHFAAILKETKAYGVGYNYNYNLGIGSDVNKNVLTKSERQL